MEEKLDAEAESPSAEEELAFESLSSAEAFLQQFDYGKAFAHYLLVVQLMPEKKAEVKEKFSLAFKEWSEELVDDDRVDELFKCYANAQELFPECETVVNTMGSVLFRYDNYRIVIFCVLNIRYMKKWHHMIPLL